MTKAKVPELLDAFLKTSEAGLAPSRRRQVEEALERFSHHDAQLLTEAFPEIVMHITARDFSWISQRMPQILTRAQARLNAAQNPTVQNLRSGFTRKDVKVTDNRQPYTDFFAVEEVRISQRQFSGEQSETVDRAVFVSADAVTVLPYDPIRDTVLLIEQFRPAAYLRGDMAPWCLEVVAGRIDPGETPEEAALRETREEADLGVSELILINRHYSTTGANTEYLYCYLAIADLPLGERATGGLESEAEDIRSFVIPFEKLEEAMASGELENATVLLSALWLQRERPRLRRSG